MKRYKKYKPSGIEWIGEIPEHWKIIRLKYLSKIENGSTPNTGVVEYWNGKIRWATPVDVSNAKNYLISDTGKKITKEGFDSCGTTLVEPSSIILTTRAPIGNVAMAGDYICTNQGCKAIHLLKANHTYLFYQLLVSKGVLESLGSGSTFKELSTDALKSFLVCLPSNNEQTVIADYLDSKTAQIDDSIVKKQKLIDLLNEEKTAIINQTVTKGLNLNAPMKDSGIPWLGQIPAHWRLKKVKWFFQLSRGFDLPSNEFIEGKYPVYGSNGIIGYHNEFKARGPGITVGRSGSVGEVNYVESDFWPHNTCLYVETNTGNDWKYIFYYLRTMDLKSLSSGTAVGTLNRNYIHEESVGFPSEDEQAAIVRHIEFHANQIDVAIARINKEIELLQEYRTALISEAVTGKIDVRI